MDRSESVTPKGLINCTNVIYMTSKCNLNCEYCYEKKNRPNDTLTLEEIDNLLLYMEQHVKNQSHIVVFGGEPLLCMDEVEYLIKQANEKYGHKSYSMSIDTNGILLLKDDIFKRVLAIVRKYHTSIKISYDGPTSYRRIDYDGNCVNDKIEAVMKKLEENNIEFGVNYTWHSDNYNTIVKDVIYIFENFNPFKIEVSTFCTEIDEASGNYLEAKKQITPYLETVYYLYKKPICDFTCRLCRKCNKGNHNLYCIPGKEIVIAPKLTNKEFDFWKEDE